MSGAISLLPLYAFTVWTVTSPQCYSALKPTRCHNNLHGTIETEIYSQHLPYISSLLREKERNTQVVESEPPISMVTIVVGPYKPSIYIVHLQLTKHFISVSECLFTALSN